MKAGGSKLEMTGLRATACVRPIVNKINESNLGKIHARKILRDQTFGEAKKLNAGGDSPHPKIGLLTVPIFDLEPQAACRRINRTCITRSQSEGDGTKARKVRCLDGARS